MRTSPYSRHYPHFNRDDLREELRSDGISYVFLGKELGGRPSERRFYCEGVADYEKMAQASEFSKGLDRVIEGAKKYRIALMCSEREPLDCHRCLLVGRALAQRGVRVTHILDDGRMVSQSEIEDKLLEISGRNTEDLFAPPAERLATAYRERARKVAFAEPSLTRRPDRGGVTIVAKATVSTIGFTKTTAEGFFERLLNAGVKKVVDVRLHNTSQLAGFAKADDLAYLLKKIGGIQYVHQPLLAPTDPMLKAYKKEKGDWRAYEERFLRADVGTPDREPFQAGDVRRRVPPLLGSDAASLSSAPRLRISQ